MAAEQRYIYRWKKYRPELRGRLCVVLARGKMNSAKVRWVETGEMDIVSRNALRKHREDGSTDVSLNR